MDIYFAINDDMIDKFGMPTIGNSLENYYILQEGSFIDTYIDTSVGAVLNEFIKVGVPKPYTICCAEVSNNELLDCMINSLVGTKKRDVRVDVFEIHRVS